MSNANIKRLTIAAVFALASTSTYAADLSVPIMPQPVEVSGWYLRGDIGFSNQQLRDLTNIQDVNNSVQNIGLGFDGAPLFGLGVGYYFNDWLRFDATGEYRSRANFHGTQVITSPGSIITDEYSGSKSEWLFLLNGYVDLGTWSGFTPFIGAGVGTARNTISSFQDICSVCPGNGIGPAAPGVAFGDTFSKWNFAWALHAGLAYKVTRNFTLELAYRYVDLGDAASGDLYDYLGNNLRVNPMEFHHLTSHDLKLGLRFNFGGDDFDRPRPVYVPPPPLNSRG
jgi:opacity protein-like surface antigen